MMDITQPGRNACATDAEAFATRLSRARVIGSVSVQALRRQDALAEVLTAIQSRSQTIFAFCNAHTVNLAEKNPRFAETLSHMLVLNDGVGMDVASKILFGAPFPDNLNGTDFVPAVLAAVDRPLRAFLLGGGPGVAEQAARAIESRHPLVSVVGTAHGFLDARQSEDVVVRIEEQAADLVLVAMGQPLQEFWAARYGARTGAVLMCVGAFLDFTSGRVGRAPRLVRRFRLEWAYRLAREPRRLAGRYIGGAVPFARVVGKQWLRQRRRWP